MAAASAGPEPEMPPKKTQTATPTMASPPGMGPTIRLARLTSRGTRRSLHHESGQDEEGNGEQRELGDVGVDVGGGDLDARG